MAPPPITIYEPSDNTVEITDNGIHTIVVTSDHLTNMEAETENSDFFLVQNVEPILFDEEKSIPQTENMFEIVQPLQIPGVSPLTNGTFRIIATVPATIGSNGTIVHDDSMKSSDNFLVVDSAINLSNDIEPITKSKLFLSNLNQTDGVRSIQMFDNNSLIPSNLVRIAPKIVQKRSGAVTIKKRIAQNSKQKSNKVLPRIQPLKKTSLQSNGVENASQSKGVPQQKVLVSQPSEQHHNNAEKLGKDDKNKNDSQSQTAKTKIRYRVLNPEDLDLCAPKDSKDPKEKNTNDSHQPTSRKLPKKSKSKSSSDAQQNYIVSVTRSGRCVRPPRQMEQKNNTDLEMIDSQMVTEALIKNLNEPAKKIPSKSRIICPFCRKAYRTPKRMARHFHTFPEHAINAKSRELLGKYKFENVKSNKSNDAETQTDFVPLPNFTSGINSIHLTPKKDAETDANFSKYHRDDKSLFRGFIRILRSTSIECRASVFIRQLSLLIVRLRKLLPCLLHRSSNSAACLINEPVCKLLDISPGKYHLDMDAIACSKIPSGMCIHSQNVQNNICNNTNPTSFSDTWLNDNNKDTSKKDEKMTDCSRTNVVEKWASQATKSKWIPVGSVSDSTEPTNGNQENWISTTELIETSAFSSSTEKPLDTWKTNGGAMKKTSKNQDSWTSDTIPELSKMDISQELEPQEHHANLVFNVEKDDILPLNIKATSAEDRESFGYNDEHFDMQMEKLNFTNAQYNEMKFGEDTLSSFGRMEPAKTNANNATPTTAAAIQLPAEALNQNEKPAKGDPVLASDVAISNTMVRNACETAVENSIGCNNRTLLEGVDLNLTMDGPPTVDGDSMLNVNDSSLDASNLSATQSVLNQLLDPLESDCLSFSESDMNTRTSQIALDLQLDLFQFHHA